jgi:hypothetical protein
MVAHRYGAGYQRLGNGTRGKARESAHRLSKTVALKPMLKTLHQI